MLTKTALVTGAGTRLGRAMALALAEDGFDVAVHYHDSEGSAIEVANDIAAMGRVSGTVQADLLNDEATQALLPQAAEVLGQKIALLVNNASIFDYDSLRTATRESWDRHIGSNLRAPFLLTQALADQVPDPLDDEYAEPLAQGLVVNMIDQRVRKLTPHFMTYTLAKASLWTLTRTAAQALAPRVRVNAIGPGPTLQGARQSDEQFAEQRENTILQRGANPKDITGALLYFVHAPAVTGQLLCVDGGQHLAWRTPDIQGVE